ncbi:MAG: hypothetical protein ACLPZF_24165 [Candidatus Acidiferrales bacterium]
MNGAKAVRTVPMTEAAAHGACLVCTVLRHHQTRLVEVTGVAKASHLCNHHAWLLARSAPTALAAEIYTQVLDARRKQEAPLARVCAFCAELSREEAVRIEELVEQVKMPSFAEWMRSSGTLCLWHAHELSHRLPTKERALVEEILARTAEELDTPAQHAHSAVDGKPADQDRVYRESRKGRRVAAQAA